MCFKCYNGFVTSVLTLLVMCTYSSVTMLIYCHCSTFLVAFPTPVSVLLVAMAVVNVEFCIVPKIQSSALWSSVNEVLLCVPARRVCRHLVKWRLAGIWCSSLRCVAVRVCLWVGVLISKLHPSTHRCKGSFTGRSFIIAWLNLQFPEASKVRINILICFFSVFFFLMFETRW